MLTKSQFEQKTYAEAVELKEHVLTDEAGHLKYGFNLARFEQLRRKRDYLDN